MPVFNIEMTYIVDVWLGVNSSTNNIRLILAANDIKMYDSFESLDKEEIYSLERIKTGDASGATAKLRTHHSKRVNDTREYIDFLEASDERALAIDLMKWVKGYVNDWKRKGKPTSNNVQTSTTNAATLPAGTTLTTTAVEKLQKEDNFKAGDKVRNLQKIIQR